MESAELLLVSAEVSVAFAGFAGIIATFQFGGTKRVKSGDVVGVTMIVQFSLNCALLSVLPLLLFAFKLEATTIWTICSLFAGTVIAYYLQSVHRSMRGVTRRWTLRLLFGSFYAGFAGVVFILLLNASNLIFHREPGPYIAGIVLCLGVVGYVFGRLLLHPLWVAVSEQEAANHT